MLSSPASESGSRNYSTMPLTAVELLHRDRPPQSDENQSHPYGSITDEEELALKTRLLTLIGPHYNVSKGKFHFWHKFTC